MIAPSLDQVEKTESRVPIRGNARIAFARKRQKNKSDYSTRQNWSDRSIGGGWEPKMGRSVDAL
jgi:hypothetical protein